MPDPQVISRKLFTRSQSQPDKCRAGMALLGASVEAECDYQRAPYFNLLALFWLQFTTHDWFSHLEEGHSQPELVAMACARQRVGGVERALTPAEVTALGCRPGDRIDKGLVVQHGAPPEFIAGSQLQLASASKTHANKVTGWRDAAQRYGYGTTSRQRGKRDPADPISLQWAGQEATAFSDHWRIGLNFFHTVCARTQRRRQRLSSRPRSRRSTPAAGPAELAELAAVPPEPDVGEAELGHPPGRRGRFDRLRDRERGVLRCNEFWRQYGLRQRRSFDDFLDARLPTGSPERAEQQRVIATSREVYGQHRCDIRKPITEAQRNPDGSTTNNGLGHADGSLVNNIEDVGSVVGWLAEYTRPHGVAISETQFQVVIQNASRRLSSDHFFTSSVRPEGDTHLGTRWVTDNGPGGRVMERGTPNGHAVQVAPLKRLLLRTLPELKPELDQVVNNFDPRGRDRGDDDSLR